jgi:dihydroorotase
VTTRAFPPILLRQVRILDPDGGRERIASVLLRDGIIQAIGDSASEAGAEELDCAGLILSPGFVDLHCHLREPGQEYRETIASGTRAAARGGFTTVCCMPNTEPAIDNRSVVEYVLRAARDGGVVRVLPIGAVTRGRAGRELAEMGEMADAGVVGFSDDGSPVADAALMRHALEYASTFDLPVIDHCEEPSLSAGTSMHEGWVSNLLGLVGQPSAAEEVMAARDIQLSELTGAHVHLAHISSAGTVALVRAAKSRGVRVTAEVTPHHLFLTHEAVTGDRSRPAYDTNARVNPPLRTREDTDACLEGLADGTIDCVATDHAPHAITDKLCEFDKAAPGISGLETAAGILLTLAKQGRIELRTVLARLTVDPVRALNLERALHPGLGRLAPGAPADLVLLDTEEAWIVDPQQFASLGKNSPLSGVRLHGRVVATFFSGEPAYVSERFAHLGQDGTWGGG